MARPDPVKWPRNFFVPLPRKSRSSGVENAFYGHGVSGQGSEQNLYHSGGNPGVVAYLIVAPYRGTALFLAANSDRGAGVLIPFLELWADFHRIRLPPIY